MLAEIRLGSLKSANLADVLLWAACKNAVARLMIENLSIIIVTWRRDDLLEGCLRSLYNVYSLKPEIVVVDNGGASTTRRLCAQYKNVKYISSAVNLGYAGGNVVGLKYCTRDFVLLLNNDTIVHSDSFSPLMDFLVENKNVGVVQGTMNRPFYGNTLDACGYYMNWFGALREYHINEPTSSEIGTYKCVAVKGAMLMFPRNLLKSVVGPLFYPHFVCNYEEVDFCLRVQKAGYECYFVPTEPIDHLCGQSLAMVKSSAMKKRSLANGMFSFFTLFPMAKGCIFVLFMMARAIRELLLGRAEAMVVFCGAFRITFRERNRILVTRRRFARKC